MKNAAVPPLVLLVEDDPTSSAFLAEATRGVPARVDCAASVAEALALARGGGHDLWLFDAQLPDGTGTELLHRLRDAAPDVVALAHTAASDTATRNELIRAGFDDVLVKPLPAAQLQSAIRDALGVKPGGTRPVWDDDAAARSLNGNRAHVASLRELFLAELPHTRDRVLAAIEAGDGDRVGAELHKLRASCGFVGAARLAAAVQAMCATGTGRGSVGDFTAAVTETLGGADATDDPMP